MLWLVTNRHDWKVQERVGDDMKISVEKGGRTARRGETRAEKTKGKRRKRWRVIRGKEISECRFVKDPLKNIFVWATVNTTTVPINFGCVGRAIFSFMYWWILVVSRQKIMPYSKEKWWTCSSYHIHLNWWTLYWCVSINTNDNFSAW